MIVFSCHCLAHVLALGELFYLKNKRELEHIFPPQPLLMSFPLVELASFGLLLSLFFLLAVLQGMQDISSLTRDHASFNESPVS